MFDFAADALDDEGLQEDIVDMLDAEPKADSAANEDEEGDDVTLRLPQRGQPLFARAPSNFAPALGVGGTRRAVSPPPL